MIEPHDHVRVPVTDVTPPGCELVPARKIGADAWELLRSPLYAMGVAAGDVVRIGSDGQLAVLRRGGNVCVQFYLGPADRTNEAVTREVAEEIRRRIEPRQGTVDGQTAGLISCTIPVVGGFMWIEEVFHVVSAARPGAQWQFGNVLDPETGQPLDWWR